MTAEGSTGYHEVNIILGGGGDMVRRTLGKLLAVLMLLALYQCLEDVEILDSV